MSAASCGLGAADGADPADRARADTSCRRLSTLTVRVWCVRVDMCAMKMIAGLVGLVSVFLACAAYAGSVVAWVALVAVLVPLSGVWVGVAGPLSIMGSGAPGVRPVVGFLMCVGIPAALPTGCVGLVWWLGARVDATWAQGAAAGLVGVVVLAGVIGWWFYREKSAASGHR